MLALLESFLTELTQSRCKTGSSFRGSMRDLSCKNCTFVKEFEHSHDVFANVFAFQESGANIPESPINTFMGMIKKFQYN